MRSQGGAHSKLEPSAVRFPERPLRASGVTAHLKAMHFLVEGMCSHAWKGRWLELRVEQLQESGRDTVQISNLDRSRIR